MGLFFSSVYELAFGGQRQYRLLMLGLDNAGKTTILYKLKLGDIVSSVPTIGFNVETVEYHNLKFTVWDVGGQTKLRQLWRHYFQGTEGLIFVVDSCDSKRLEQSAHELHTLLASEDLQDVAVLVLANKQDVLGAVPASEIADKLGLSRIRYRHWYIQACSAVQNQGVYEGLDWLATALKNSTS